MTDSLPAYAQIGARPDHSVEDALAQQQRARAAMRQQLEAQLAPALREARQRTAVAAQQAQLAAQQAQARVIESQHQAAAGGNVAQLASARIQLAAEAQIAAEQAQAAAAEAARAHQHYEAAIRAAWRAQIDQLSRQVEDARRTTAQRMEAARTRMLQEQGAAQRELSALESRLDAAVSAMPDDVR